MMGLWRLLVGISLLAALASGIWLYQVKTQARLALREISSIERQQATLRREIEALDIEWAYLNGPEHLRLLTGQYSDELKLENRRPDSFARLSEIPPRGAGTRSEEDPE